MDGMECPSDLFAPDALAGLARALAEAPDELRDSYLLRMWRYAIQMAPLAGGQVPKNKNCDAIPYLPVSPESWGVPLSETSRVLDIGCLGGYGLFDLAGRRLRAGLPVPGLVGVDVDRQSVELGRSLSKVWGEALDVDIRLGQMEHLPIEDASCDLVIARLVLPYCNIRLSLAELSRVMKPGSALLVQLHAPRYYLCRFVVSLKRPRTAVYYARPLVSGLLLAVFGVQPRRQRWRECSLSLSLFGRLARTEGLERVWAGGAKAKPLGFYRRNGDNLSGLPRADAGGPAIRWRKG